MLACCGKRVLVPNAVMPPTKANRLAPAAIAFWTSVMVVEEPNDGDEFVLLSDATLIVWPPPKNIVLTAPQAVLEKGILAARNSSAVIANNPDGSRQRTGLCMVNM